MPGGWTLARLAGTMHLVKAAKSASDEVASVQGIPSNRLCRTPACLVWAICVAAPLWSALAGGCAVVSNLPAPGDFQTLQEPEYGRTYHTYIPSYYDANRRWPLLIACHGTVPFDTAERQRDQWAGLAEQKGFLVAAPELLGTSGLPPEPQKQIQLQGDDEKAILSVVQAMRASRRVEDTRVFMSGWSAGGYAVLYTGLRHPEVFRGLSISQGNFTAAFVEPCIPFIDHHQSVQIIYGSEDPLNKEAVACGDWLRMHGITPVVIVRPGIHKRDLPPVIDFFEKTVREKAWVRIQVREDIQDDQQVTLSVSGSFEPKRYLWDFGDGGQRSEQASPTHRYAQPGQYAVKVALWDPQGRTVVRQIELRVPRIRLGAPR